MDAAFARALDQTRGRLGLPIPIGSEHPYHRTLQWLWRNEGATQLLLRLQRRFRIRPEMMEWLRTLVVTEADLPQLIRPLRPVEVASDNTFDQVRITLAEDFNTAELEDACEQARALRDELLRGRSATLQVPHDDELAALVEQVGSEFASRGEWSAMAILDRTVEILKRLEEEQGIELTLDDDALRARISRIMVGDRISRSRLGRRGR
ncbi:MAG: hypothetical protein ACYTDY_06225 [Planctomycetota bacterium]|jgi:hypothetical protein